MHKFTGQVIPQNMLFIYVCGYRYHIIFDVPFIFLITFNIQLSAVDFSRPSASRAFTYNKP